MGALHLKAIEQFARENWGWVPKQTNKQQQPKNPKPPPGN